MRVCKQCGEEREDSAFYYKRKYQDSTCKACRIINNSQRQAAYRIQRKSRKYGLRPGEYEEKLEQQKGRCAICGEPPTGRDKTLSIDHDHEINQPRDLLCHRCNIALGLVKENKKTLLAMARYVEKYQWRRSVYHAAKDL